LYLVPELPLFRLLRSFAAVGLLTSLLAGCALSPFGHLSPQDCMTRVMYFESNRSSPEGMLAVGTVVMNRVHDRNFPNAVCAVVGQPNQFAAGVLWAPMKDKRSKALAEKVAAAVLSGRRHPGLGPGALYFHTAGYHFPYDNMYYVLAAGGNVFYEKRRAGTFPVIDPDYL
jgi:spore germination cell wall hydrolase CwlJ-like protein